MLNIAYVIDAIETPGAGTEKQLLTLINSLDKKMFSPHLIVLRSSAWLKNQKLSFPVYNINLATFASLNFIRALRDFRQYCKSNDIAVVQTFFRDGNVFGTVAAFLSRVRIIISSRRNYGLGYWHNCYWLMILKTLRALTTAYIANCEKTKVYTAASEGVEINKIHVVCNGINLEAFRAAKKRDRETIRRSLGVSPDQLLIGSVANLRPVKNLPLFVRAAKATYQKFPHTKYLIVGEGPERRNLENLISSLNLDGIVMLAGRQDDVMPYLNAMDVGILCSKSESLSNAIIEYLAAGLPCLVSDAGGNLEAIGFHYGLHFRNGDCEELVEKLEWLVRDSKLRRELGESGKKYAFGKYDQREVTLTHEKIYEMYYARFAR